MGTGGRPAPSGRVGVDPSGHRRQMKLGCNKYGTTNVVISFCSFYLTTLIYLEGKSMTIRNDQSIRDDVIFYQPRSGMV